MDRARGANLVRTAVPVGQARPSSKRQRGSIETLPSGSLRVKVYAGYDPVPSRRHHLDEMVPAGTRPAAEAEKGSDATAPSGRRAAEPQDPRHGRPAARPLPRDHAHT